jgi:hypothetical protein
MFPTRKSIIPIHSVVILLLLLFSPVMSVEAGEEVIRKKLPYGNLPESFRHALEQQDLLNEPSLQQGIDVEPVPWLNPAGEQLVALVEQRTMTRKELIQRVALVLADRPSLDDPIKEQDRRIIFESQLLADWVKIAALAHHSLENGFTVSDEEVDEALAGLSGGGKGLNHEKTSQAIRGIGIADDELRREVHDSLLVEKLIHKLIEENVSDVEIFRVFRARPLMFLEPTQVNAWHLYFPIKRRMLDSERRESMKVMGKFRKKLGKCRKKKHYDELLKLISMDESFRLRNMGWVGENDKIPELLKDELFSLDPGKTSEIIKSGPSYHVVKVMERKEGEAISFEMAKPRIINILFEQYKDLAYEGIKGKYKVYRDASGLNKWVPVRQETPDIAVISGIKPADEPDLRLLRKKKGTRKLYQEPPPVDEVLLRNYAKKKSVDEKSQDP